MVKKAKSALSAFWKDESAQGSTEYILLLAVVVIIAVLFKDRIKTLVQGRLDNLDQGVKGIDATGG
jgi:Flp pilus assembly pilin Flp